VQENLDQNRCCSR